MSDQWLPILRRRGVSVLFQSYINQGYKDEYYQEVLGVPSGLGSHRYVDGWVIIHVAESESFTSTFIPRLSEPTYVQYFLRRCAAVSNELLAFGAECRSKAYDANDPVTLLYDFMTFSSRSIRVMPFLNTMVFVQDAIERQLRHRLSTLHGLDEDSRDLDAMMQKLMAGGDHVPLASQAMVELSQIAKEVRQEAPEVANALEARPGSLTRDDIEASSPHLSRRLDAYLAEYDFLGTNYYLGTPTTFVELLEQIGGFIARAPDAETDDIGGASTGDPAEEALPDDDKTLLETAQTLQYLREYRLEALYKSGRECRGLLSAIAEHLGTSYTELLYLTFEEIQAALTGASEVDLALIAARMADYASYVESNQPVILTGDAARELERELPHATDAEGALSGVTAYPGERSGPIRIVDDLPKIDAVEAGDILAAPMTMPYHVPAMARSAAVLTDEGGILSHAAIVARELRVPCVVGLKSVTSTFRDGEEVIVRATASGGSVERVPN